jgi:hypothetical protein
MKFIPLPTTLSLLISFLTHAALGLALPDAAAIAAALPEPVPDPADAAVISGNQVAILYQYNTTSTNPSIINLGKECQGPETLVKLNKNSCWTPGSNVLGIYLSSVVSEYKGMYLPFSSNTF